MPVTLSQISSNTAKVRLIIHNEDGSADDLNLTYYPAHITEKTFAQLAQFEAMKNTEDIVQGFQSLNDVLSRLVKSWDLYVDDKQTQIYPIEPAKLAELPIVFRMNVLQAIMGDIRPETIAPQMPNS